MTDTFKILGQTFRPMNRMDWDTFAGAAEGSLICFCEDETTVLLYYPAIGTVSEVTQKEDGDSVQRDWFSVEVG